MISIHMLVLFLFSLVFSFIFFHFVLENDTHEDAMQNDNSRRDANILKFFMNIQVRIFASNKLKQARNCKSWHPSSGSKAQNASMFSKQNLNVTVPKNIQSEDHLRSKCCSNKAQSRIPPPQKKKLWQKIPKKLKFPE